MKKLITIALLALLGMLFFGCEGSKMEYTESFSNVVKVEFPDTVAPDIEASIKIFFQVNNGCGVFSHFETLESGNETDISVYAKYPVDAICTQAIEIKEVQYKFPSGGPGSLVFNVAGIDTIISGTVVVSN